MGVGNSRGGWKEYQRLTVAGNRTVGDWVGKKMKILIAKVGLAFKLFFSHHFLTMKTTVLRTFVYTVKVKWKEK